MIVCHITDGSYSGAVGWHCNQSSGVSSHYVVSRQGKVTEIVPIEMMAWCNGTTTNGDYRDCKWSTLKTIRDRRVNANLYTISIECEGYYNRTYGALTDIQLDTLVELIQHIRMKVKKIYGIDIPVDRQHIVGHFEINPKTRSCCPGHDFPWKKLIEKLRGNKTSTENKIYRVQVGAYKSRDNALAMAEQLKLKGYPAIIKEHSCY